MLRIVKREPPPDMLAAALDHLAHGRSVIPICSPHPDGGCRHHGAKCHGPGKTPLTSWKTFQNRLPTEAEVRLWFKQYPSANIGMATGAVSGAVVLDTDNEAAVQFVNEQGGLEGAPMVTTGKGFHFYLTHPGEEVRNFAGNHWNGVDFRGDGGYVLLPPSLHYSGRRYAWHATQEDMGGLGTIPDWLMAALKGKDKASAADGAEPSGEKLDLDQFIDGIGQGQRDTMIYKLACSLRGKGTDYELARFVILSAARQCDPPFEDDEALAKLDRAWETYDPPPPTVTVPNWDDDDDVATVAAENDTDGDPYPIVSLEEYLAVEDEEDEWLVDKILAGASLTWFASDPGTGKTLFAIWLGLHVAEGRMLQGSEVSQGTCLFISEDTGSARIRRYTRKLVAGGGFSHKLPFYVNPSIKSLRLTDAAGCRVVKERVERYGARLLILDACERLVPSADYKGKEYDPLTELIAWCRERRTAVIMIDHTNKGQAPGGGKPKPSINRIIGSRAKSGLCDFAIEFNGKLGSPEGIRATFVKARDQEPPELDIHLVADYETMRFEVTPLVEEKDLNEHERAIRKVLKRTPGVGYRLNEIVVEVGRGVHERTIQRALKDLLAKQIIQRHEDRAGGGRTVLYSVPDDGIEIMATVAN